MAKKGKREGGGQPQPWGKSPGDTVPLCEHVAVRELADRLADPIRGDETWSPSTALKSDFIMWVAQEELQGRRVGRRRLPPPPPAGTTSATAWTGYGQAVLDAADGADWRGFYEACRRLGLSEPTPPHRVRLRFEENAEGPRIAPDGLEDLGPIPWGGRPRRVAGLDRHELIAEALEAAKGRRSATGLQWTVWDVVAEAVEEAARRAGRPITLTPGESLASILREASRSGSPHE